MALAIKQPHVVLGWWTLLSQGGLYFALYEWTSYVTLALIGLAGQGGLADFCCLLGAWLRAHENWSDYWSNSVKGLGVPRAT